jgi:hypothetical protein
MHTWLTDTKEPATAFIRDCIAVHKQNTTTATSSYNTNIADYISFLRVTFSVLLSVRNTVNANTVTSLLTDCAVVFQQNVRYFITTYLKQKNAFN